MKTYTVAQSVAIATIALASAAADARISETNGAVGNFDARLLVGDSVDAAVLSRVSAHLLQASQARVTEAALGVFLGISESNG